MTKKELKEIIKEDKSIYFGKINAIYLYRKLTKNTYYEIGKYIIIARKAGFYKNHKSIFNILKCIYYDRKKNKLGQKLNIELAPNEFGRRLRIFHGNVVVNRLCKDWR